MRRTSILALLGLLAAGPAAAQDLVIIGAPADPMDRQLVVDMVASLQEFVSIDDFDATQATPTLGYLSNYHAALVYSSPGGGFASPPDLGDVLADFVELGRGVVVLGPSFANGSEVKGRFASTYLPVTTGIGTTTAPPNLFAMQNPGYQWLTGYPYVEGHQTVYGFNYFDGGNGF